MSISGLTTEQLKSYRQARGHELLNHVKSLPLAADVNELNADGVALVSRSLGMPCSLTLLWLEK